MSRLAKYFDLTSEWGSVRITSSKNSQLPDGSMTYNIIGRQDSLSGQGAAWKITLIQVLRGAGAQYLALVLGIAIQPFFAGYQNTSVWAIEGLWGRLLFSVIAGVIIFPAVYKNAFDPDKPLIVQLGAIFAAGMGWESLLATALTAAGA